MLVWRASRSVGVAETDPRGDLQVLALIPLYARIAPSDPSNEFTLPSAPSASLSASDDDFDFPATLLLLSESKSDELATRFRREADAYYLEAKRSMVSSISQIPVWIYGVLVLLGWNEFIAVIRSPVYFTFLLLVSAAAYVTYHLNMVSSSWRGVLREGGAIAGTLTTIMLVSKQTGPVIALARGVSNEVIRTVNEQLHST